MHKSNITEVIGKSGSSKTTLTALLQRFYDIDNGKHRDLLTKDGVYKQLYTSKDF